MSELNARCGRHPEALTTFTCPRCGTFGCVDCERRSTLDGAPICPSCWKLAAVNAPAENGSLQLAGLIVGLISILPCCPLSLISLGLNGIAIARSNKEHRWKPLVGLGVTLLGVLLQVLYVVFSQIFSRPR